MVLKPLKISALFESQLFYKTSRVQTHVTKLKYEQICPRISQRALDFVVLCMHAIFKWWLKLTTAHTSNQEFSRGSSLLSLYLNLNDVVKTKRLLLQYIIYFNILYIWK